MMSALVALARLHIARRRELRKLSLDMYKEFYSREFSESRYEAERFFDANPGVDWSWADPYLAEDPHGDRKGYASVTRYFARLSILYKESELDRDLAEKFLSRICGYWWGSVYDRMTQRGDMYTRNDIRYICENLKDGCRSAEFENGYQDGIRRRSMSARSGAQASVTSARPPHVPAGPQP